VKVCQVDSPSSAISFVVDSIKNRIEQTAVDGIAFHVAISGGRSMPEVAAKLDRQLNDDSKVQLHLWFADERFVDFEDSDRNDSPIISSLGKLRESTVIHRFSPPSQSTLEESAEKYAGDIDKVLGGRAFDMVIVSMGEDGHVASIFPQRLEPENSCYAVTASPKPPSERTTLSLSRLANTKVCIILATGESKRDAVARFLNQDANLPAVKLAAQTETIFVTDIQ
jgi:6-phosphogluconolactonase